MQCEIPPSVKKATRKEFFAQHLQSFTCGLETFKKSSFIVTTQFLLKNTPLLVTDSEKLPLTYKALPEIIIVFISKLQYLFP